MVRGDVDELRRKYEAVFTSEELKAKAFDKIAENYYFGNFGTMQKSDIDVLLFSLYIEEILNQSEEDVNSYSDYTLARQLGITQSKVSTLKVKKQLQYPYAGFDWKKSFKRLCENARYENEKIRINLRDKNLFYELKNQIDESGGYVEATLTQNLLVITPAEFFDLTEKLMTSEEIKELKKVIKNKYPEDNDFCNQIEKASIGKTLKAKFGVTMVDVVCEVIKDMAPAPIEIGIGILKAAYTAIVNNRKEA